MAYRDDILATSPDYLWTFDNTLVDEVVSSTPVGVGLTYSTTLLCEDTSNSLLMNATTDSLEFDGDSTLGSNDDRKAVMGWFRVNAIQQPPKNVYREGANGAHQFNIVLWAGNNIMFDVSTASTIIQAFGDQVIEPNRSYCLFCRLEGTGFGNKVEMYIDGVKQSLTEPANGQLGTTSLATRFNATMGALNNTQVGGESVLLNACVNGFYSMWAFWHGADAQLTDTEIRDELFEKGAIPGTTISTNSEANMQIAVDALADTVRGNEPLNIRVEDVSGGGTLNLTADNITHDPLASIHVQFMGTGTLNWTNTNGSNATIGSTPNGGTINFVNPAVLTLSPLIANSEVRIYDAGTTTEVAGIESSTTSFSTSISVNTVDVVVHKEDYEYIRINSVDMTSGDISLPIDQVFDRNYT